MCLNTVDKKRKTGIKVGYKIFKLNVFEDGHELCFPYQYDTDPITIRKKTTDLKDIMISKLSFETESQISYPSGFHFFIYLEEAKRAIRFRRAAKISSAKTNVLVLCKIEKLHTTGTQNYNFNGEKRLGAARVGVCRTITPLEIIYPKKENKKCQKSTT